LDIYTLCLSDINEASLKSLFAKLPNRCIILLEDIDAVSSNRDAETESSRQIVTGSPSKQSKPTSGKVSLSALLNVIDGVGSQEGRILIMTTNHITRLDEALIRPGRVDKKVKLGLADNQMAADLFCLVFKPVEGDVAFTEDAQSGEKRRVHEVALGQREEAERVERLAKEFAGKVPELKFSPAEIFSFLLEHRKSPEEAIDNVEQLISKLTRANSKLLETSKDVKPEDVQSGIARDPKLVRL
jgi:chaperone BCS1